MRLIKNKKDWENFSAFHCILCSVPSSFPCLVIPTSEEENFIAGEEVLFIYPNDVASLVEAFTDGHELEDFPPFNIIEDFIPLLKEACHVQV